jgi:hypothetical protein
MVNRVWASNVVLARFRRTFVIADTDARRFAGPVHTVWMGQPCRWSCMVAATMQFDSGTGGAGLRERVRGPVMLYRAGRSSDIAL